MSFLTCTPALCYHLSSGPHRGSVPRRLGFELCPFLVESGLGLRNLHRDRYRYRCVHVSEPVEVAIELVFDLIFMGILYIRGQSPDAVTDGCHDVETIQATAV